VPVLKKVNKDFFKKWTHDMAYVVGFFAEDGYITVNRRGGQFWCMDITDRKLIEGIREVIGSEHRIGVRKRHKKRYTSYRLQIGSIEICDDMRKLGFKENKTKSLAIPHVPKKYFSDFVRGYFDGDGNVWVGYVHKDRVKPTLVINTVFTSCSKPFLDALFEKIYMHCKVSGRVKKGNGNFYRLVYSVNGSLKLYDFMYNRLGASKLFLKRKKDVFERYMKMRA
jgi:hypothetical protein